MSDILKFSEYVRTKAVPLPESAREILYTLGGVDLGQIRGGVKFKLHRSRDDGVQIMCSAPNGFSWNLSIQENIKLKDFREARKWVAAYAQRFGQSFIEDKRTAAQYWRDHFDARAAGKNPYE